MIVPNNNTVSFLHSVLIYFAEKMSGPNLYNQGGICSSKGESNTRVNMHIPALRIQSETPLPTSCSQTPPVLQPSDKLVQLPPLKTSRKNPNCSKLINTPRDTVQNMPCTAQQTTKNNAYIVSSSLQSNSCSRLNKNSKYPFKLFLFPYIRNSQANKETTMCFLSC